ncbi:uncharacterized protein ACNLHF_001876 [Anomaloglossus baeobatrachus]
MLPPASKGQTSHHKIQVKSAKEATKLQKTDCEKLIKVLVLQAGDCGIFRSRPDRPADVYTPQAELIAILQPTSSQQSDLQHRLHPIHNRICPHPGTCGANTVLVEVPFSHFWGGLLHRGDLYGPSDISGCRLCHKHSSSLLPVCGAVHPQRLIYSVFPYRRPFLAFQLHFSRDGP